MTLQTYQYVVLRCVPRAEREEFVNVGVVLRSQGHDYLRATFALDEERLRALSPDLDVAAVHAALEVVCDVALGRTGGGRPDLDGDGRRFGWISAPRSTVVRPGPVHGGLTQDPAAELERLLDELVR
ncbi:DUF3037 domain-containing protein [Janibacter sp. UYMM211]|uniref:DUF3037 domain-containing protein n=1 Tax=Janibacter sp. UYMM211 TaxID=3156342 RepID=UPI003394F23D